MSWPTVTTGAGSSADVPLNTTGSLSWSHTISATDTLLEVFVGQGNSNQTNFVTGVTWNGAALTQKSNHNAAGGFMTATIWEKTSPAAATGNIVVNYTTDTGNGTRIAATSISFDGASTTTGTVASGDTNNTSNPSLSVGSVSGDTVVSFWATDDEAGGAKTAGGTSFFFANDVAADCDFLAQYQPASGTTTSCSWTYTTSNNGAGSLIGVAIKQGSAAAAEAYLTMLPMQPAVRITR